MEDDNEQRGPFPLLVFVANHTKVKFLSFNKENLVPLTVVCKGRKGCGAGCKDHV